MIRALLTMYRCLRPTPIDRADCAITRAANLTAEAERERIKANFYTCMLLDIDPYTEWNLFAQIKQKEYDAQFAHNHLQERANTANIRAEARIEELKEKPNENSDSLVDVVVGPVSGAGEQQRTPNFSKFR